jgi:hypothetical protein
MGRATARGVPRSGEVMEGKPASLEHDREIAGRFGLTL